METLLPSLTLHAIMGRRPQQYTMAAAAAVAQTTVAVDDKGEDARVALVGLTIHDDIKTHARAASSAAASVTLSSEECDDPGYEDDLDNTPVAKWKRRRRQRIHTALMPYPVAKKTRPFSSSARALPSLSSLFSSWSENQPGLANAGLEGPVPVPFPGPDERQRRMAQAARRLANLRVQSVFRQWREEEEEGKDLDAPEQQQEPRPAAACPTEEMDEAALARAFDGFSLSVTANTTEKEEEPITSTTTSSARALCERIRQQARRKLREERKRVLLARQVARDEARKHAAASALTTTTTTALIPVTEEASIQERRLAFADRAAAFQRQQRVQAALDAWQQLAAAAAAKQELERELRLRLEAAAVLLGRLRLRGALRTWRGYVKAAAAKQQATARGAECLAAAVQRRALRAWRCAGAVEPAATKQQQKALPPPLCITVTGAGEVKPKGQAATAQQQQQQQKQAGLAWWAAACGWFRDEVARVVAPPRRRADADEYLDCM